MWALYAQLEAEHAPKATFEECTVKEKSGETLARVSSLGSCKGACSFFQRFLVHSIKLIPLLDSTARQ